MKAHQIAWVPGKLEEPVPVTWSDGDVALAWAERGKIARSQFEREVRRLFPRRHEYVVTLEGDEWKAEVT